MTDQEIISQVLDGDTEAFSILVEKYQKLVFHILNGVIFYNKDCIEDVAQDIFITIFEKLQQYNPKYDFKNWLYTISLNKARKFLRKKQSLSVSYLENLDDMGLEDEKESIEPELQLLLSQNIQELSPRYQEVLFLFYSEDKSTAEIADILNKNENTIKTWLKRSREKLKKKLKNNETFSSIADILR